MLNVLKMNLYRLFHTKFTKIIMFVFMTCFPILYTFTEKSKLLETVGDISFMQLYLKDICGIFITLLVGIGMIL